MAEMVRIAALILAAGSSSRMGRFKPLLPLGTSTFIEEATARFRRAGIADVRVVIGHRAEELRPVLERIGARWVFNPDHEKGMFSSVLAGVRSFESSVEAFLLLPADIPLVSPSTVRALLEAWEAHGSGIVYPRFGGKRGHPPLIPASVLKGGFPSDVPGGLRAVLARHEEAAADVDVIDEAVLLDCDTPEDYRSLERRWAAGGIPSEKECEAIWSCLGVSEEIRAHSRLVAELARILAVLLNRAGLNLDVPLIAAAGLLHDIARRERDHALAGADLLVRRGYPRVGTVVARHVDIHPAETIARPHGLGCIARRDLREISLGSWEGRTFDEVRRDFAHEFRERGRDMLHYRTPGGESFLECSFRVMGALYDIRQSTRGDILIFSVMRASTGSSSPRPWGDPWTIS
jgi:CTP:molybdopterin cytidylyltransferase MocA